MSREATDTPFAGGRWTEWQYVNFVRRGLDRLWVRWPCRGDALEAARRPAEGRSRQTKWEYQCASCKNWFLGKEVQVDHIAECGTVYDLNVYAATLFCETSNLQVLCKGCHQSKTAAQRKIAKGAKP